MRKVLLCPMGILCLTQVSLAGPEDSLEIAAIRELKMMDSINSSLKFQKGKILVGNGIAQMNIPAGFKYLGAEQSKYVLTELWGNPPREDILGMIFPENGSPFADSSFAFIVSFEETGYVKDKDANKIDYDDMLKELQNSEPEANSERSKLGYEPIHVVKWAQSPYYDEKRKVLHWAKELKFGSAEINTLNYDVRVLGRKGILSMNAVSDIDQLNLVRQNIEEVIMMPEFTEGNRYSDFNSNSDKVAEYGIGALVAGGIMAKTGMLATIGKFLVAAWKFILIGVVALVAGIRKYLGRKKNEVIEEADPVA